MDKNNPSKPTVEYVEATPIEPEGYVQPQSIPQFRTISTSSRGCGPCCGPIGCLSILVIILLFFSPSDFIRNMIVAGIVVMSISTLAGFLAQRR